VEGNVNVKRLRDSARLPRYATPASAGADLCADLDENLTLLPGQRALVPTGIAIAPEKSDLVGLIFSRSGMGAKNGITLANSVGVIDSDYRGEIKVALINHGSEPYEIHPGDRIAQLVLMPVYIARFVEAESLDDTARGVGGFGSTGKE